MDKMIAPLQDKIEEWKKTAALLDKDHAKGGTDSSQLSISKPGFTQYTITSVNLHLLLFARVQAL